MPIDVYEQSFRMKPLVMTAMVFCLFFVSRASAAPDAAIKSEKKSTDLQ
jgi:hypothetical protein